MSHEDLRLVVRTLVTRPAESVLLILSAALVVGSVVTGVTVAGTATAVTDELLSLLRHREIVVSTRIDRPTMQQPARAGAPNSVVLTHDDLQDALSVSPAIR